MHVWFDMSSMDLYTPGFIEWLLSPFYMWCSDMADVRPVQSNGFLDDV